MSTMIAEVYNAFIQAKCPKDIAEKAAVAISSETKRESETIKIDIQRIELKVDKLDKDIKSCIKILKEVALVEEE